MLYRLCRFRTAALQSEKQKGYVTGSNYPLLLRGISLQSLQTEGRVKAASHNTGAYGAEPVEALVQTLARSGARARHEPLAATQRLQLQCRSHLGHRQGLWQVCAKVIKKKKKKGMTRDWIPCLLANTNSAAFLSSSSPIIRFSSSLASLIRARSLLRRSVESKAATNLSTTKITPLVFSK